MYVIERFCPSWKELIIHESSPCHRGASLKMKNQCKNYISSQYFPFSSEKYVNGWLNINLESQKFEDDKFDLVVTQDVFEHLPHPDLALNEICRTLKKGGYFISTIPLVNKFKSTERWAILEGDQVVFLKEPDYHGNPIGDKSPVFWHYGYDIQSLFNAWSKQAFDILIINNHDDEYGLDAEFLEVLVCRKK